MPLPFVACDGRAVHQAWALGGSSLVEVLTDGPPSEVEARVARRIPPNSSKLLPVSQ
jgi:hypothetical protein